MITNKSTSLYLARLSLLTFFVITACTSTKKLMTPVPYDVQSASEQGVSTDFTSLQEGHALYMNNCGKCHALVAPPNRTIAQWNKILPKMFPKTKLTEEQQAKVRTYVMARRTDPSKIKQ